MQGWRLEQTYATLPSAFFSAATPTPVADPQLVVLNRPLAVALGIDPATLSTTDGANILAGNAVPPSAVPLAQAYAGHQFGHFTTLGDGRAILLGEQITPDGRRLDIQLKGAGPTRYSRRGDGRAALGPMLREYVISEAMAALGIPTTRSLAVVATGEPVYRERVLPGAVLTRVAASHLRVGTFEFAATRRDRAALRALADYTRERHYPEIAPDSVRHRHLFEAIVARQASLIARWQLVGFIHGVMNTDNMSLAGETIDYGPCAFMDVYDPRTVFSSIDEQGRYAYQNQPAIAQWNLARLAEAMLPLFDEDEAAAVEWAEQAIASFGDQFEAHWLNGMRRKVGITTAAEGDLDLVQQLLAWVEAVKADFTDTFRRLSVPAAHETPPFIDATFLDWHRAWQHRLSRDGQSPHAIATVMQQHNPALIARNHLVEAALAAAVDDGDLSPFEQLVAALAAPYDGTRAPAEYLRVPPPAPRAYRTFCGT